VKAFRSSQQIESWVIYQMVSKGVAAGAHAVCEQAEWDAMERQSPGRHFLIQSGIENEAVAERLARGTSGDPLPRQYGKKLKV